MREGGRCNGVTTDGERFGAEHVVLAAGAFSGKIEGVAPARSGASDTRADGGRCAATRRLRHVLRSERGYIVPREDASPQHVVIGSTLEDAGFEKRVTPRGLEQILSAAQELVPALGGAEVIETWCGLRPDTPDHLPLLGPERTGRA